MDSSKEAAENSSTEDGKDSCIIIIELDGYWRAKNLMTWGTRA